jgi:GT2 family glycosyltransferase
MNTHKPTISVVLINFHDLENTLDCLFSLHDVHPVVVNIRGESSMEDAAAIQARFPDIDVLESENLGFSGCNNKGAIFAIEKHHPDYLVFLNNDTRVDKNMFAELVAFAQLHADGLAAFAPKIYFESGREFHKDTYTAEERGRVLWYAGGLIDRKNVYAWHRGVDEVDEGQFDTPAETGFLTGCCLMISRENFERVGSWDEKYFLYLEDLEYSRRLQRKGGKLWYVPAAKLWHKNAGSNGGSGSDSQIYYQTRNRLYFGLRYAPLNTKLALVKESVKKIMKNTQIEKEALIDAFLGKMKMRKKKRGIA